MYGPKQRNSFQGTMVETMMMGVDPEPDRAGQKRDEFVVAAIAHRCPDCYIISLRLDLAVSL